MDAVLRGLAVYVLLLLVLRMSGKRVLGADDPFDFVLLLIIADTTQQALLGADFSVTNSFLLIVTLVSAEIGMSLLKRYAPAVDRVLDGVPLGLIDNGRVMRERMHKALVDESDILQAAREHHGLERLDQIRHAVLERSGGITIVPQSCP